FSRDWSSDVCSSDLPIQVVQVERRTKTSASPWKTLCRQGVLRRVLLEEEHEPFVPSQFTAERHALNPRQQAAVDAAVGAVRAREIGRASWRAGVEVE